MEQTNVQTGQIVHLSPRQVADAIGVSASSLKRWCDRGDIPTTKTAGGHRRIAVAAVVRFLRDRGHDLRRPELLGLPSGVTLETRDADEVVAQIVSALKSGDEACLISVLTGLYLANYSLAIIGDHFIRPAFETIGRSWQRGELEIYQEHRAVVITRNALHHLRGYQHHPEVRAPRAISATLSGDPYLLPLFLIELGLRELGWNAIVLGPNHPAETLCAALRELRPRLICINVSFIEDEQELVSGIQKINSVACEVGAALAIGGGRVDEELRRKLPCTAHCASMADLVSLARALEPTHSRP